MNQEKVNSLELKIQNEYSNIAGIAVTKSGQTLYENYFNKCNAASQIHVYSVTKSIISILIGIAIDRGCIKSVDQEILDFFPKYRIKKREKIIQKVTLENLLTMTAPYKYKFNPYIKYFTSADWVTFSLDLLGGRGKIGDFRYAPIIGPDILSGILFKTTGQSVLDFAKENLFTPLGITVEDNIRFHSKDEQLEFNKAINISGWAADSNGINAAGWGLTLSPKDMARIGQLYLDNGAWNGRQIVSKQWVDVSIKEHSRWEKQKLGYGYLWWIVDANEPSFAAMGDGGNTIYVNKEKKIVISITALFRPKARDSIKLIKTCIEPIFDSDVYHCLNESGK